MECFTKLCMAVVCYWYAFTLETAESECIDKWPYCYIYNPPCLNQTNVTDVRGSCPKRCGLCPSSENDSSSVNVTCRDKLDCSPFNLSEGCQSNYTWHREHCRKSCNMCLSENETTEGYEIRDMDSAIKTGMNLYHTSPKDVKVGQSQDHEDVLHSVKVLEVTVGSLLQLSCRATCLPNCTLVWQKVSRSQGLQDKSINVTEGEFLQLANIKPDDLGIYRCVAADRTEIIYCQLCITTKYSRPALTILDNGTQVDNKTVFSENSTIIIRCTFGSNPEPQVMWYIESEQSVSLDQQKILTSRLMNSPMDDDIECAANPSSLVIPRARCEDTNTYLCVSNNSGVAETKGRVKIEILCAPRNTDGGDRLKEVYRIFSDEALSVRFKIRGYPPPRIDSMTSFDGDGKACILPTPEQYQQIINNSIAQPWLTLFTLQFPRHVPDMLSCSYVINISNDAGNITMTFKTIAKDPRCDKCSPSSVTQAALISAVVILVVCLIIILAVTKLKRDLLKFSKFETVATHEIQEYRRSIEGSERGRTNFSATDCHIYNEPSDDIRLSGRGAAGRSSERSDVTIQTCHLCNYSHVRDMCLNAVRSSTINVPLRNSQLFVYSQSQRSAIPPIENRLSEQYDVCTMSDFTSSLESLCLPDIYRSDSKKKYYLNPVYENAACEDSLSDEADDYINLI